MDALPHTYIVALYKWFTLSHLSNAVTGMWGRARVYRRERITRHSERGLGREAIPVDNLFRPEVSGLVLETPLKSVGLSAPHRA